MGVVKTDEESSPIKYGLSNSALFTSSLIQGRWWNYFTTQVDLMVIPENPSQSEIIGWLDTFTLS